MTTSQMKSKPKVRQHNEKFREVDWWICNKASEHVILYQAIMNFGFDGLYY